MNLTFEQMQRIAEDAEVAAVLETITAPASLELEPITDRPAAAQSRVTFNALDCWPENSVAQKP